MGGEMVRYRSQEVEVDGAVYQVRAQSKEDGRVQVQIKIRGGGEAAGELVAPADGRVPSSGGRGDLRVHPWDRLCGRGE
jgi:hypothetical protein